MADRYRDERDTNYFRESYTPQDTGRYRDTAPAAGRDQGYQDADMRRGYNGAETRDYAARDGGRTVQGSGYEGRNWAERTGDEVRSWAGDNDAERRLEMDSQKIGRYPGENPGESRYGTPSGNDRHGSDQSTSYGQTAYGRGDYGSSRYSQGQGYGARTAPSGQTHASSSDYSNNDYNQGRGPGGYGAPRYDQGYAGRPSSYSSSSYSAFNDRGASNRAPVSDYQGDDRGFLNKAADELKSWFGDDEAERRRQMDATREDATQAFGGGESSTYEARGTGSSSMPYDPHYAEYRRARMEEYDRDYHEYRKTKAKDFHDDFHNFRTSRVSATPASATAVSAASMATMASTNSANGVTNGLSSSIAGQVHEHQVVVGSDGQGVGKIDHVTTSDIKLTKHDSTDGKHHLIPLSWVASVEGDKVKLSKTSDQAMREWRVADAVQNGMQTK